MKVRVADLITKGDEKFITLDVINYEGIDYGFVNKLDEDEEPTEELKIFNVSKELKEVKDEKLANKLLLIFQKNIQQEIEKIMKKETE